MSDLTLISEDSRKHEAWRQFEHAMGHRAFCAEASHDAWIWFRDGYDAKIRQMQAAATNWWCDYNG